MAHVRKDTLTTPGEWAKHLRPYGKKVQAHAERQAAKKEVKEWTEEEKEQCARNFWKRLKETYYGKEE